jgi:hypothetical protein
MDKKLVVVLREWRSREVKVVAFVTDTEVGAMVGLDDFKAALKEEIGNPAMLLTKRQIAAKIDAGIEKIMRTMKQTTVHEGMQPPPLSET